MSRKNTAATAPGWAKTQLTLAAHGLMRGTLGDWPVLVAAMSLYNVPPFTPETTDVEFSSVCRLIRYGRLLQPDRPVRKLSPA